MTLEGLGRCKFAELVADHGIFHENGNVLAAIVHRKGVPDEVRQNGGTAGPGLDYLRGALLVRRAHLVEEVLIDERAFL